MRPSLKSSGLKKVFMRFCVALFLLFMLAPIFVDQAFAAQIQVTINSGTGIGYNNFSPGFVLHGDIYTWSSRSVLREQAEDANFKMVRIFADHLMSPCSYWYESSDTGNFNWGSIDTLIQRIYAIGAEPLITLGFYSWEAERVMTPRGMATNPTTGLPYPDSWAAYCAAWVRHFKSAGLPVKYYEIVNEPHHYFGWGPDADRAKLRYFMDLFYTSAGAMRRENSNIMIGNDNSVMKLVLDYFMDYGDLDFLSYHSYGTGSLSASDEVILSAAETRYITEGRSWYGVERAREVYRDRKGVYLPVINTENNANYHYGGGTDSRIQQMLGAVYTALSFRTFILKDIQHNFYYTFGGSGSSSVNFGMVNLDNNRPWYPYYAQKMFGQNLAVGDKLVESSSSSGNVRALAWINNQKLNILLICKSKYSQTVYLSGVSGRLTYQKIDDTISWRNPSVQTGTIDSGDAINMNGYTVMLLQSSSSTPPPPAEGHLNVKGYYDDSQVTCTVSYTGPEGSSGTETAYPPNGYTWQNIPTGSYTVYGEYQGTQANTQVYVYEDYTTDVQLDFGGSQPPSPPPSPPSLFSDHFESADFREWTGTTRSSGESLTVVNTLPFQGNYHGRFTSNGGSGTEYAYCYKSIDGEEVYARGYFYVAGDLPLDDNGDRFYFLRFRSGSQSLAGAGIRRNGGVDRWIIYARDGNGWVGPVYATSPVVKEDHWYCLELHWKRHSSQGLVELYVDGTKILEITGIDTTYFGNIDTVDFGLISATNVQNSLIVYGDSVILSDKYISPET